MNNSLFPQYTTEYISKTMSLRKPQEKSLQILEELMLNLPLGQDISLDEMLKVVHERYPICTDFEREFPSVAFALATGIRRNIENTCRFA